MPLQRKEGEPDDGLADVPESEQLKIMEIAPEPGQPVSKTKGLVKVGLSTSGGHVCVCGLIRIS